MLSDGMAWLDGERRSHMSDWVSYQRGAVTHPTRATPSRSAFEVQDANGVIERWESRDFVISIIDLPFATPERGDRITETHGAVVLTYEVMAPRGMPVWQWDAFRTAVRIHTKLVGEV